MRVYILSLLFVSIFIGGCSYKNSTIELEPYKVNFISFQNKKRSVYIDKIEDKRIHKNIVAVITDKNSNTVSYKTTHTNFLSWYKDALKKALKANGFSLAQKRENGDLSIFIVLNNIVVTFDKDTLTKENLHGTIALKLIIKKGRETIIKNISEKIDKYSGPIISDKIFKEEIETLLNDSIKLITKHLLNDI